VVSLLDFINFISQTDDILDVSARTVAGEVIFQRPLPGEGSSDPTMHSDRHLLSYGPERH